MKQIDNRLNQFNNFQQPASVKTEVYGTNLFRSLPFEEHLKPNETAFGKSGQYVYVYDDKHRVNKFKLVGFLTRKGINGFDTYKTSRRDLVHESSEYVTSFRNTDEGISEYKKVIKGLKVIHPNSRIVKIHRCPQRATKERGTVAKSVSTHFDVYCRKNPR